MEEKKNKNKNLEKQKKDLEKQLENIKKKHDELSSIINEILNEKVIFGSVCNNSMK